VIQPSEKSARLKREGLIDLQEASTIARRCVIRADSVSTASMVRWIIGGKSGVKLEAVRVKGNWHTSIGAIIRFSDSVNAKIAARHHTGARA
jgi:hypothetical protein